MSERPLWYILGIVALITLVVSWPFWEFYFKLLKIAISD